MAGIVLVAEDEGLSQRLVAAVIQYCGMEAKVTGNGKELMEALSSGIVPEIILLDLEMPVMDGIEVLKSIQHVPPEERCPILVFTANNQEATVREAITLGADDFVVKPFKTADLAQRIKDLTFEVSEAELKQLLYSLHVQDHRLAESAWFKKRVANTHDLYPLPSQGKKMCVAIPKGQAPQQIARFGRSELRNKIIIYRESGAGWRKIWPRSGSSLNMGIAG